MCQDLSTCHECPVKKAIANLPIRLKGSLCGNNYQMRRIILGVSLLEAQNKDIGATLQTL